MTTSPPESAPRTLPADPVLDALGVRLLRLEPGLARFELVIRPEHANIQGALHGGVTATLLDVAGGYAGLLDQTGQVGSGAVTVSLTVNYVSGITAGTVLAEGRIIGGGRTVYFIEGRVITPDGTLIAAAQGTYRRIPKPG